MQRKERKKGEDRERATKGNVACCTRKQDHRSTHEDSDRWRVLVSIVVGFSRVVESYLGRSWGNSSTGVCVTQERN